ncbi:MAG: glutamate--tRNA ligase family protein [Bacteroidota bacterium]
MSTEPHIPFRTRLAPTPSGYLHLGNLVNFAWAWLWTKKYQGQLILRIDDLDKGRWRPKYVEDIFRSLEWIGLAFDEGPSGPEDFYRNFSQHTRLDQYATAIQILQEKQRLYACTCSRKQILLASPDGSYPGTCSALHRPFEGPQTAWRIRTDRERVSWEDRMMGPQTHLLEGNLTDFVIRKKDGLPAYQLASLVDDVQMGVSFIVRGQDLQASTAAQLWLARQLNYAPFLQAEFFHHPLITQPDGQKLSKSEGAMALKTLREQGTQPARIIQHLGSLMGLSSPQGSWEELMMAFVKEYGSA